MNDVSGGAQGKLRESISALIDGEADELELRRVLASTETRDVRDTWRDYHLQRDMLTGVDMQFAHIDISQRVQAALADETLPAVAAAGTRWWRPLASVAVAASVATVVVIGARSFNASDSDTAAVAQVQPVINAIGGYPAMSQPVSSAVDNASVGAQLGSAIPSAAMVQPLAPAVAQPVSLDPDQFAQQRLQQYLLRHTERAALNNGQGVINFAKVSELGNAQ